MFRSRAFQPAAKFSSLQYQLFNRWVWGPPRWLRLEQTGCLGTYPTQVPGPEERNALERKKESSPLNGLPRDQKKKAFPGAAPLARDDSN